MGDAEVVEAPVRTFPRRPARKLHIEPEQVIRSVKARARQIKDDANRLQWEDQRLQRYAKYRGWLQEKTVPWPGAANVHISIMQISELRANAGLHNVIMTMRPLMSAKAAKREHVPREDKITQLIDAQLFLDPGPDRAQQNFEEYVAGFLQDGNVVAYTPWVRDERDVTMVHFRPPVPEGIDPALYLVELAAELFKDRQLDLVPTDQAASKLTVTYRDERGKEAEARLEVYEQDDGTLELVVKRRATIYDGPVMQVLPIESILVPTRASNLQPPAEWNPKGAPYVFMEWSYTLDEVRRQQGHDFNWLDAEGLKKLEAQVRSAAGVPIAEVSGDRLQEQKDLLEGREHQEPTVTVEEDAAHLSVPVYRCFDRWDVDGDGQAEDVYWVVARDVDVLLEARLLAERWPAERPYRPLADAVAIPVKDRWYGISYLELGEALYDLIKGIFDLSLDSAKVSNIPWFFYGASSKLETGIIRLAPGEGYPVPGVPRDTIWFPNLPTRDQQWAFQFMGLALGLFEKLMMIGDLQLGRVPTGKASALRTFGTTAAILQQGDVRADQLLLRLFSGLRQIAANFHRMNRHLLPPGKEIRLIGYDGPREQGYQMIQGVEEIDAEVDFEFRPDFLLSNPAVLAQTMQSLLMVVGTPLAFQLGLTDASMFYTAVRDYVKALRLDHKRYVRPPTQEGFPPILWEEALSLLLSGKLPQGPPLEGLEAHFAKIQAFMQTDQFGLLNTPEKLELFRVYVQNLHERSSREQTTRAANAFQQMMLQQGGGGAGGIPTAGQEPSLAEAATSPTGPGVINA